MTGWRVSGVVFAALGAGERGPFEGKSSLSSNSNMTLVRSTKGTLFVRFAAWDGFGGTRPLVALLSTLDAWLALESMDGFPVNAQRFVSGVSCEALRTALESGTNS